MTSDESRATSRGILLPKRICYLETQDKAFLTHRIHLGRAALATGAEVHVIAPGGAAASELRAAGFIYHPLGMKRASVNPLSELVAVRQLFDLYREIRPDIVHHIALKSVLYGSAVARALGIPAVGSVIGLGYTFNPGGPSRVVLREAVSLMLRAALSAGNVHLIFQNPDDRAVFTDRKLIRLAQTSLIPGSGVDTARFAPVPEPNAVPRVLFAARMLQDKGLFELADAARILRKRGVPFELHLAGNPDPENPASVGEEQLRAWHDEGIANWLGHAPDMAQLLRGAHIACLPSYSEGLPLFLIEAAASARPAVTTDVPGNRSVVEPQRTGLIVPARDPISLANALERLLRDPELRRVMGQAAREKALAEFAKERINDAIFDVYSRLLTAQPARSMC